MDKNVTRHGDVARFWLTGDSPYQPPGWYEVRWYGTRPGRGPYEIARWRFPAPPTWRDDASLSESAARVADGLRES